MKKRLLAQFLLLASLSLLVATTSRADDTDIYLTPSTVSRNDSPNVLFIIDNSGSMNDQVQVGSSYDPSVDYSQPPYGGTFDNTKIYWINTNLKQTKPTSPTSYPGQYFSISNNYCTGAKYVNGQLQNLATIPNVANPTDTNGSYTTQAAAWNNATGWQPLSTSDLRVDCSSDNPADSTGTYLQQSKKNGSAPSAMYTNTSGSQYSWSTSNNVVMYSGNYLNYSTVATPQCTMGGTPGVAPYCPTKMQLAQAAVNNLIDSNPGVRFGLMTYNYDATTDSNDSPATSGAPYNGGRVAFAISDMGVANPLQPGMTTTDMLHSIVNSLTPATNTPLAETLYEAYLYLSGQAPYYGNATKPINPPADLSQPTSSSTTVAADGHSAARQTGGANYLSPFLYQCQQAYIILVTDGDPTLDQNADSLIKALPGIAAPTIQIKDIYSGATYYDYLNVLAGWMFNNDIYAGLPGIQRAVLYPVGFNANSGISSQGLALLQSAADMGQGKPPGKGLYSTATDANSLSNALENAIIDIENTTSSFAAPALSVNAFNRLFNRDDVYFAMFKPSTTTEWDGNVKKFKLNTNGDIIDVNGALAIDPATQRIKDGATSYWSSVMDGGTVTLGGAGSNIPSYSTRTVYTYTGTYPIATPVDLSASTNLFLNSNTLITGQMLGLSATASATDRTNLINWVRGEDSYNAVTPTAQRWAFSDPLHSRPVAITFGGTNSSPVIKLFVGTNDGMVRMINDATGVEEWAFLPPELFGMQYTLSQDGYGGHPYGMDSTPTFWLIDNNNNGIIEPQNGDKVYMFIGMRRGGRNIYAFDVTPTTTLTNPSAVGGIVPKLMWVIRGGLDASYLQLGYTFSRPQIANIRVLCKGTGCLTGDSIMKTVLIFAGGYDPHQDSPIPTGPDYIAGTQQGMGNAIYIVDPLTGSRIWWGSAGPDSAGNSPTLTISGMDYSIPSDLALLDTNADGAVDRIYAPDTSGRIWRVDLSPTIDVGVNSGTRAYLFADIACPSGTRPSCTGTALQDRRKFFYPPDYAQVSDSNFSTTANYDVVTIESGDRSDPLDKQTVGLTPPVDPVHNRIYAFRDYSINSYADTTATLPSPIIEANMYDATADVLQNSTNSTYTTDLSTLQASEGWYVSLLDTTQSPVWQGEKGLAKTTIYAGTLYATTYTPPSNTTAIYTCSKDEGLGKMYALNLLNATAVYDYNNSGSITVDDRQTKLGGGIPSELVVVIRDSGVTGLVGTSGGAAKPAGIPSGSPRFKTYWYQE